MHLYLVLFKKYNLLTEGFPNTEDFLLPPRGSFVIVKFSTSLNLSRNMNISVRSLYHMILEKCLYGYVCVCTNTALSPDLRGRF